MALNMDLADDQAQISQISALPDFSELRPALLNRLFTSEKNVQPSNDETVQSQAEQASIPNNMNCKTYNPKHLLDIIPPLDSGDLSIISRLYEIPTIKKMINDPAFQNIFNVTSNVMGINMGSSMSQAADANEELDTQQEPQNQNQQQVTEYIQKLQSYKALQLFKFRRTREKQNKLDEGLKQNSIFPMSSILNVPSIVRTFHQPGIDQMQTFTSNDLTFPHEQQENERNLQAVHKVERQVQTDMSKSKRKSKFRAKIGEIKMIAYGGTTLYYCPECNLSYPNKSDIEQHIKAHLQERKYRCDKCGAMLKRKEHLDQHMRGHSDERPFICNICHKAFKRNEHLTRHCQTHSGKRPFDCDMCPKAFARKDHLNKHMQTHLGIRKNKTKEDSYCIDKKNGRLFDNKIPAMTLKQETFYPIKDGDLLKHDPSLLQHLQNSALLHSFSSFKEEMPRNANVQQAQSDNTNGNARYLLPPFGCETSAYPKAIVGKKKIF